MVDFFFGAPNFATHYFVFFLPPKSYVQGGPKLLVRNFGCCLRPPHGDFHKTNYIQLILGYLIHVSMGLFINFTSYLVFEPCIQRI